MDAVHVHLMLTHFPIIGTFVGVGILAYGQFSNNDAIKQVALATFIIMSLLTIPVFLSGEGAEEAVEHLPGVTESIIEEHEELAEKAIWLMGLLGIFSVINLFALAKKLSSAKVITIVSLVLSLATVGLFIKVGNLGGQIRHTEIRADNTQVQAGTIEQIKNNQEDDD